MALIGAGCGSSDDDSVGRATAVAERVEAEQVASGTLLARIRGHHAAALERYKAGDREAALEQARNAADTRVSAAAATEGRELRAALAAVVTAMEQRAAASDVQARIDDAAERSRSLEEAATSAAYTGSVIASLTSLAADEYGESLKDGRIARADEFLEGFGFLREAEQTYRRLEARVREKSAREADEIDRGFEQLGRAMPSGEPPARPVPADQAERAAKLIGAELEETVGARVVKSDPKDVGERIERLLNRIARTYDPADPDPAAELAAEAYIENYEVIEAGVIDAAPGVNAKLEPLLGSALRKRIREGAPQGEIEAMVRQARALLRQALAALESGA